MINNQNLRKARLRNLLAHFRDALPNFLKTRFPMTMAMSMLTFVVTVDGTITLIDLWQNSESALKSLVVFVRSILLSRIYKHAHQL